LWNGEEWLGVRKAREKTNWVWGGIPPITDALMGWGVSAGELMGVWHDNVEPPPEAKWVYEPYELVHPKKIVPILTDGSVQSSSGAPFFPKPRPDVPPSVFDVAKTRAQKGDSDLLVQLVDDESLPWATWIRDNTSRSIWLDWVVGRLPFSVPIIPGFGALQTSIMYERCARVMWSWALAHRNVTYDLVLRAAYTAELNTWKGLRGVEVLITG